MSSIFVERGNQQRVVVEIETESEGAFDAVDHYVEVIISAERDLPRRAALGRLCV